ncbi:MAG: DsbA family protein [Patescibacteria group bacterium]|nr:DsbA family protein [Patescibacteria group bacterium]
MNEKKQNSYLTPISIIIAGIIIAGAIFYSRDGSSVGNLAGSIGTAPAQGPAPSQVADKIKPVSSEDHILGSIDARVKIVEFSDIECPFCKRFHVTMNEIIDEYGEDGQVAWIFRHFPLDSIHSKARKEAQAVECANKLGGNEKFWSYLDRIFEITPSNNRLDLALLPQIAVEIGLNQAEFETCLEGNSSGGKYAQHIEEDYQDAVASGGRGTPYSIVIAKNGKKFIISGAQPYSAIKSIIELALKEG